MKQRKHPDWLKVKIPKGKIYNKVKSLLRKGKLHTVCEEAKCPNIAECFGCGTATFMILGDTCTRDCRYCNIPHGTPNPVKKEEPKKIAKTVKDLKLKYVVITSVTRDDLDSRGAKQFAETIKEIKKISKDCRIEVLIPDLDGNKELLNIIKKEKPFVINHNIEVVKKLFSKARPQGNYQTSLKLLKNIKKINKSVKPQTTQIKSKSGLMIGLGETQKDIIEAFKDLRKSDVDIVTIGQYLRPSKKHLPIEKYYSPKEFEELKKQALALGFKKVMAGPLVRSSYHAGDFT